MLKEFLRGDLRALIRWPFGFASKSLIVRCTSLLVFLASFQNASAASLGGAVTPIGVMATLLTLVIAKGWHSDQISAAVSLLAALLAFAVGAGMLFRSGMLVGSRSRNVRRSRSGSLDVEAIETTSSIDLPTRGDSYLLLRQLRRHFFDLHSAWDKGAGEELCRLTTPDMLKELRAAASEGSGRSHRSHFLTLHAELLLFEERVGAQIACVEYSGLVREEPYEQATPFRELWMLTRALDSEATGWRLARHQGLL